VRVPAELAASLALKNLSVVHVDVGERSIAARVRICPELPPGVVVLPESCPEARALAPSRIDAESGSLTAAPAAAQVRAEDE